MTIRALTVALALLAGVTAGARAEEVAVPFDPQGRIERVDAALRRALDLWPGQYPDFGEARLFAGADSSFVLQIVFARDRRLVQERLPLTPAEARELRARIAELLSTRAPQETVDPTARTVLVAGSTMLGLGYYSWALPVSAELHDKGAVAAGMLSGAGGFLLPFFATRHEAVTPGMAQLALYGGTRGLAHGMLLRRLVAGPEGSNDAGFGWGMIGSVLEGVGGYFWAREAKLDAGRAHLIGVGGDLGLGWGIEAAEALDLAEGGDDGVDRGWEYASTLTGAALGLAGGALLGARRAPTWGDAELLRTTSLVGQGSAAALWNLWSDDGDGILTAAALGGVAGAVVGDRLTRHADFSGNQAVLIDLGTIAGAGLGSGIAFLTASKNSHTEDEVYALAAALGGMAGFTLTTIAFADDARDRPGRAESLRFSFEPWLARDVAYGLCLRAIW